MSEDYKAKILAVLDTQGGLTTGQVARNVRPIFGINQQQHSGAIRSWLMQLKVGGLVRELDEKKPVSWVKTGQ